MIETDRRDNGRIATPRLTQPRYGDDTRCKDALIIARRYAILVRLEFRRTRTATANSDSIA